MSYYMKAWMAAATLPIWMASHAWYETAKLSGTAREAGLNALRHAADDTTT